MSPNHWMTRDEPRGRSLSKEAKCERGEDEGASRVAARSAL